MTNEKFSELMTALEKVLNERDKYRNQTAAARSAIIRFDEHRLTADECVAVIRSILV